MERRFVIYVCYGRTGSYTVVLEAWIDVEMWNAFMIPPTVGDWNA